MTTIGEEYTDGVNECPFCKNNKFVVEFTRYYFVEKDKNGGIENEYNGDEEDIKVTCSNCEKEVFV